LSLQSQPFHHPPLSTSRWYDDQHVAQIPFGWQPAWDWQTALDWRIALEWQPAWDWQAAWDRAEFAWDWRTAWDRAEFARQMIDGGCKQRLRPVEKSAAKGHRVFGLKSGDVEESQRDCRDKPD
jgi:hypothetical protein